MNKNKKEKGILLPIFSLPNKYGIGTIGKEAYKFIDFLKEFGFNYWQILPLSVIEYSNSPYSSISSFACNYYFIDEELLLEDKLIEKKDLERFDTNHSHRIDYSYVKRVKKEILDIAINNLQNNSELEKFKKENAYYINDYALFLSIKTLNNNKPFNEWEDGLKFIDEKSIKNFENENKDLINYYIKQQFLFYKQWNRIKKYANANNVKIIGDIPIYIDYDSADVWAHPKEFLLDENLTKKFVGGCPPDYYAIEGQLWGNPLYDYSYMKQNGYDYFINKFSHLSKLYDVIRIDHFRGFESFYAIPKDAQNAIHGEWMKASGKELFDILNKKIFNKKHSLISIIRNNDLNIIAEDLGFLTKEVHDLIRETGFPGMRVFQFAFSDDGFNNMYFPHNYQENVISYIGTHDNDTFYGWYNSLEDWMKKRVACYIKYNYSELKQNKTEFTNPDTIDLNNVHNLNIDLMKILYDSKSRLSIFTVQDILGIGTEGRLNEPSTVSDNNWSYILPNDYIERMKLEMNKLTEII